MPRTTEAKPQGEPKPVKLAVYRLEPELHAGLLAGKERDGLPLTWQVKQAIRAWLASKGIRVVKAERKRAATRKRP